MKKLAAILMIFVLAISFLIGTSVSAKQGPNNVVPPCCFLNLKYPPICVIGTCQVLYTYTCPWGTLLVWEGDYCCDPEADS